MAAAGPGEVMVSDIARTLAAASGFNLEPRGTRELKGLDGARCLVRASRPGTPPSGTARATSSKVGAAMALLVDQLQWSEPLTPESPIRPGRPRCAGSPGASCQARSRASPRASGSAAPTWIACAAHSDPRDSEQELAGLVTSQENACRYCYGSARVRMKMIGFWTRWSTASAQRAARRGRAARARAGPFLPQPRAVQAPPEPGGAGEDARGRLQRGPDRGAGDDGRGGWLLQPRLDAAGGAARAGDGDRSKGMKGIWNKLSAWLPAKQQMPRPPAVPTTRRRPSRALSGASCAAGGVAVGRHARGAS